MKTANSGTVLVTDDLANDDELGKRASASRDYATSLAERLSSEIDLVHVDDVSSRLGRMAPSYRPFMDRYLSRQKARLSRARGTYERACRTLFLSGDPINKIVSLGAKRGRYELITLTTHGRKGVKRLLLGSVAEEVIKRSMTPVMTIGPGAHANSRRFLHEPTPTIFLPTGLTPNSDRAEKYAVSLAKRLVAKIVLFHSMKESLHPILKTALASPKGEKQLRGLLNDLRNSARRILKNKCKRIEAQGVQVRIVLDDRIQQASEAILKNAGKTSASLIVMGTHGRSLLAGAFLGRTARDVILGAAVPVITVRSHSL